MDKWVYGEWRKRNTVHYFYCTSIIDCAVINWNKKNIQLLKRTFEIRERPYILPSYFLSFEQCPHFFTGRLMGHQDLCSFNLHHTSLAIIYQDRHKWKHGHHF